jgi:hypothetical protein
MSTVHSHLPFSLRQLLLFDAVTCLVMGMALVVASGWIAAFIAAPRGFVFVAGLLLLPIAGFMAIVATRPVISTAGTALIVAGNLLWVAASIGVLVTGWVTPNAFGVAFIGAQAVAVAGLAWLEQAALRGANAAVRAG